MPEEQQQVDVEKTKVEQKKSDEGGDALGIAFRQFGALLGAVGLLSLLKDALEWQHNLALYLDAFRALTRPIATFLFGWIAELFHWSFPGWEKDYLTVGVITTFALLGTAFVRGLSINDIRRPNIVSIVILGLLFVLVWPLGIAMFVVVYFDKDAPPRGKLAMRVFASVFVYAAIMIVVNYALIYGGARVGE
jgi:hypothetical protein